jgi:hypothetical protein
MSKILLPAGLIAIYLCVNPTSALAADKSVPADQDQQQTLPKEVASDTNKDGKPDRWEKYLNGQPVSIEADGNYDGIVDEKGFFANGKLVKVEKDSDGDGKIDKWVTY